jgi:hypothetical protein
MAKSEIIFILFLESSSLCEDNLPFYFFGHQDARFHQKTVRISASFTGEFSPNFDLKIMISTYTKNFSPKNGYIEPDFRKKEFPNPYIFIFMISSKGNQEYRRILVF